MHVDFLFLILAHLK